MAIRKKDSLKKVEAKTVKTLIITLSLMIAALATCFVLFVGQGAQNGYALEQEKQRNEILKEKFSRIKTQITNSTSFQTIEDSQKVESMRKIYEKTFITEEDITL